MDCGALLYAGMITDQTQSEHKPPTGMQPVTSFRKWFGIFIIVAGVLSGIAWSAYSCHGDWLLCVLNLPLSFLIPLIFVDGFVLCGKLLSPFPGMSLWVYLAAGLFLFLHWCGIPMKGAVVCVDCALVACGIVYWGRRARRASRSRTLPTTHEIPHLDKNYRV